MSFDREGKGREGIGNIPFAHIRQRVLYFTVISVYIPLDFCEISVRVLESSFKA
jgi:hypothetical protein